MFPSTIIIENTIKHDFYSNNFYCYLLKDPKTKEVFYIGKGKHQRIIQHKYEYTSNNHHKNSTVKNILNESGAYIAEIVYSTQDEFEAYVVEDKLIDKYSKIYNITNIGRNGPNPPVKPTRAIHQYNLFGEYIKTFTSYKEAGASVPGSENILLSTVGKQIMECCRGAVATYGGYYWSYYDKPILRYKTKTRPIVQFNLDEEYINRYISAEHAAKCRTHNLGNKYNKETLDHLSKVRKGNIWWNNGIIQTMCKDKPGDDWVNGRLNLMTWWNNGIKDKRCEKCPGDDWANGRLYKSPGSTGMRWRNDGINQKCSKESPGENWVLGKIKK